MKGTYLGRWRSRNTVQGDNLVRQEERPISTVGRGCSCCRKRFERKEMSEWLTITSVRSLQSECFVRLSVASHLVLVPLRIEVLTSIRALKAFPSASQV